MRQRYIAALQTESDGGFSVSFPDIPEIATQGDNWSEAVNNAEEAMLLVVEAMIEDGEPLPEPSKEVDVASAIIRDGGHPHIIEVETTDKAERINLSIPANLVQRIDRAADKAGKSRSGFILDAVREAL